VALGGCAERAGGPQYPGASVVIVSIDTLRPDHLPAYGYLKVETPHLDRFRKDAILFERAYTHVPLTLPAHASLMTGLLPFEHGVRDNLGYRLDTSAHPTLATLLKEKGYATAAAVSAYVLRGGSGLAAGFDLYDDRIVSPPGSDALGRVQRPGSETAAIAARWLEGTRNRPVFLFFHVYEPHAPYDPPEPFRSRYPLAYDGEVAAADAAVGTLLDALRKTGLYDQALVLVLSDHGEGLGEHGEDEHGILLYRWALHVPLLLKLPGGARAGDAVATPVALVDVLPTLGRLLPLPLPEGFRGRSLLDENPAPRRLYAETSYPRIHLGWSELRSLLDERWQYVEGARRELYDLVADPGELHDQLAAQGPVARSRQKELADLPAAHREPGDVSREELEKLAALGYLGGAAATRGPLPDPRERMPVLQEVKTAFRLAASGRDEEAVPVFRKVLGDNPLLFDARYELAQTLVRLGRPAEAYDAYTEALGAAPSLAGAVALDLGRVCLELGRLEEAEANAGVAERASPAKARELRARIALARDDLDGAERAARAAAGDLVAEQGAAVVRAEVRIRREEFEEAVRLVDDAIARAPVHGRALVPDLHFLKGDALARLGRLGAAEAAFREEIRMFPKNRQAYARLAVVLGLERRTVAEVDRLLESMAAAAPGKASFELAAKTLESMGDGPGARAWRARAARAAR
jgi:arylsulfatase A-like enzyme/Flp pilus assembly protein TadD